MSIFRENFSHTHLGVRGRYDVNFFKPDVSTMSDRALPSSEIELRIHLKINLRKDNDGSLAGPSRVWQWGNQNYHVAPWPDSEWNTFRTRVLDISRFWNNRFWLKLTDAGRELRAYKNIQKDVSVIETINNRIVLVSPMIIRCAFSSELSEHNAHYNLNAVYLVDPNGNPVASHENSGFILRSDAVNIDSGDVYGDYMIAHEIGHQLGLPHIGVETNHTPCTDAAPFWRREDHNARACYDSPIPDLNQNIMGSGTVVDWRNAVPWRVALRDMTGMPINAYIVHTTRQTSTSFLPEGIYEFTPEWNAFNRSSLSNGTGFFNRLFN